MNGIGFIGAGTVATALAISLSNQGYRTVAVSSITFRSAEKLAASVPGCRAFPDNQDVADSADFVFITTPDSAIAPVALSLKWRPGQYVLHCSGADTTALLEPARNAGASTGVFHPLQTFAAAGQAVRNIPGTTFAIEAPEPLLGVLKDMAVALDGHWVDIKASDKVAYHAAAVFACNYLVTLVKMATDLWQGFGVSREQAVTALMPLLRGTLNNIENIGLPRCLTGPIARGDTGTIEKHLAVLGTQAPGLLSSYRELGLQTISIALEKGGINTGTAGRLQSILKQDERKPGC